MNGWMKLKMITILNHERYKIIGGVLCFALAFWFYGCESKVPSLVNPQLKINRVQLQLELDSLIATTEARVANLDRQDAFKTALLQQAVLLAQGGTINPVGLGLTIAAILGIGATVDDVRTRKRVKNQQPSN